MTTIHPTPYQKVIGQPHDYDVILDITKQAFDNVKLIEGQTVISYEGCFFRKLIITNSEEIDFKDISMSFFGCYIEDLEVENIVSKNISIGFYGSLLSGSIRSESLTSVDVMNCLLNSSLFLLGVSKVNISYYRNNLNISRWRDLFSKIKDANFRQFIGRKQSYYIDTKNLYFGTNFKSKGKKRIVDINLSITFSKDSTDISTIVENAFLSSLSINGDSNGKISIENTRINQWYMYDFSPKKEVSFYNIMPSNNVNNTKIGIHRCNFDNAWFENVYFDHYNSISFYRTKFSKAIFSSCNFPGNYTTFSTFMPIENVHYPNERSANYEKEQYEIFLQLKKSLETTGNYHEAQKLQAISNDALIRFKDISKSDRLILRLNSWSNDHGLSIKRPFWGFLISTFAFYLIYLFSLGKLFTLEPVDWDLFGYYFSFIDITHRPDFLVEKDHFNIVSLTVDYLNKLVMGFFIYQFIASFRKYGKK